jgi:hypothetical protein
VSRASRTPASIAAELGQLREALENAHQRNRRLEEVMQAVFRERGIASLTIEVFDVYGCARKAAVSPPARRRPAAESIWPLARPEPRPLRPTPGLAHLTLSDQGLATIGVSLCGFNPDDTARIVEAIAAKQASDRNFVPVFLTDSMAPEVFRRHRFAFEYFPMSAASRILAGTRDWNSYAVDRLALLQRKYAFTQIITFGKQPFAAAEPKP